MPHPALVVQNEYLTREETAQRLNLSPRTLEKWVTDGRIQSRKEPNRERLYVASDVERLRAEREARAVRPPERNALARKPKETPLSLVVPDQLGEIAREVVREWREAWAAVAVKDKLWLTWKEGSAYSGLPMTQLKRLAAENKIQAQCFGRAVRIQRASLEAFAG